MQANLDRAHKIICEEYSRFRLGGGTATSPYAWYFYRQLTPRRAAR
jgi:hypothetical protein